MIGERPGGAASLTECRPDVRSFRCVLARAIGATETEVSDEYDEYVEVTVADAVKYVADPTAVVKIRRGTADEIEEALDGPLRNVVADCARAAVVFEPRGEPFGNRENRERFHTELIAVTLSRQMEDTRTVCGDAVPPEIKENGGRWMDSGYFKRSDISTADKNAASDGCMWPEKPVRERIAETYSKGAYALSRKVDGGEYTYRARIELTTTLRDAYAVLPEDVIRGVDAM